VSRLRPMAAANDPSPTAVLMPLKATATVQALCSKMNKRLVRLTAHIRGAVALMGSEVNCEEILLMESQFLQAAILATRLIM